MKTPFFRFLLLGLILTIATISCQKDDDSLQEFSETAELNQEALRACGLDHHMNELLSDPEYRQKHQKKLREALEIGDYRATCTNKIIIPVAVHYQRLQGSIDVQCLRDLAQNQIDILNADYGGTNADISNWNSIAGTFFPGINNGEACIEFCLATKNHPTGYGLNEGDPAVTINQNRRDSDRNWAGYINIFVRNIQYLGYSPLGGSGNGDGVVIDNNAFGSAGNGCGAVTPGAPYDLGRTLTHELGHYLLLDHIWGAGCSRDDGVSDTPDSASEYYGCPAVGAASCGSNDMHMNYMDYTNDACMYMFSAGQAARMENYLTNNLANVVANGAIVCGETEPPCTDCPCEAPTGFSVSSKGKKTTISWVAATGADSYEVQLRLLPGGSFSSTTTSGTSVNYNRLANGSYEYQVRSICGGSPSAWSPLQTFTN